MPSDRVPLADGSGAYDKIRDEEQAVAAAEQAVSRQDWPVARELWHGLVCSVPQNKHYRTS